MSTKKITTKEKTAGQIILDHTGTPDKATANELTHEALEKPFDAWITEWIETGRQKYPLDFFIILNLKLEQSLLNAPHLIPELRQTCPDPFYDQSVWHYHKEDEKLEYLWSIPDIGTARLFRDDPLNCPSDQVQLRDFVLDYCDGTLQRKVDRINEHVTRRLNERSRNK